MTRDEMEQGRKVKKKRYYDFVLLFLVMVLVCFGLVMIYSVSYYNANKYYGNPYKFLTQQAKAAIIGVLVMVGVSLLDYRIYVKTYRLVPVKLVALLYLICLLMQIYLVFFGESTGGSQRWIPLPIIGKFQPSEVTKICIILMTAYLVKIAPQKLDKWTGFVRIVFLMSPLIVFVTIENLSTGIVTGVIFVAICFVASRNKKYYFVFFLIALLFVVLMVVLFPYRGERFEVWRDIENHPKGYQILQGLYAIASGGMFGKGLGQSVQKLGYIPEAHNDMIFSVICEELGLVGGIAVLMLFCILLWRMFLIAINAPDLFGGLIVTGVMAHIAVQVLINVCVVTNTIPSTGIPLPFISYGGTSLLMLMGEMGLVLSVSFRIEGERE